MPHSVFFFFFLYACFREWFLCYWNGFRASLFSKSDVPRTYPKGFGEGLTGIMGGWRPQPRLRQKRPVNLDLTDKELFQSMELGDLWEDACLVETYRYLRFHKKSLVPLEWQPVLEELDAELDNLYPAQPTRNAQTVDWHGFWGPNLCHGDTAKIRKYPAKIRKFPQKSANRDFWILGILGNYTFAGLPCKGFDESVAAKMLAPCSCHMRRVWKLDSFWIDVYIKFTKPYIWDLCFEILG